MSYWVRQLSSELYQGDVLADEAQKKIWAFQDVPWRTKLILAEGKTIGKKFLLTESSFLSLPSDRDPAKRLFVLICAYGTIGIQKTDGTGTHISLLRGTAESPGIQCFDDIFTTLFLTRAVLEDVYVEYSMMELPDLNDPLVYREGEIVRGIAPPNG